MARQHVNDPGVFSREYDAVTERQVTPFYRTQITADRARFAEMNALEEGLPLPPPDPVMAKLLFAAPQGADVLRGVLELAMCVALPQEVVSAADGSSTGTSVPWMWALLLGDERTSIIR
jgi:hypothetical protein